MGRLGTPTAIVYAVPSATVWWSCYIYSCCW